MLKKSITYNVSLLCVLLLSEMQSRFDVNMDSDLGSENSIGKSIFCASRKIDFAQTLNCIVLFRKERLNTKKITFIETMPLKELVFLQKFNLSHKYFHGGFHIRQYCRYENLLKWKKMTEREKTFQVRMIQKHG